MLIFFLLLTATSGHGQSISGRIIGGTSVTITDYPYQVSIIYNGTHECGGSILSNQWILTAAHCVYSRSMYLFKIRMGSMYASSGGTVLTDISAMITHQRYEQATYDYDIALIKLNATFNLSSSANVVKLPSATYNLSTDTQAVVTGWGKISNQKLMSEALQALTVPIVDQTTCAKAYTSFNIVTERMLCAGYMNGTKDTCQGDSGGPLVYNDVQVGIVSWGSGCAAVGFPGVYTRITAVREWITKQTGI